MTASPPQLIYEELMSVLRALCEERLSGTLFISTDENHAVSFRINEGDIVDLSFRATRGSAALPQIKAVHSGQYRFTEGDIGDTPRALGLASTEEILKILTGRGRQTQPLRLLTNMAGLEKILANEAAEIVGPIAKLICTQKLSQRGAIDSVEGLKALLSEISMELGEASNGRKFTQSVLRKLNIN